MIRLAFARSLPGSWRLWAAIALTITLGDFGPRSDFSSSNLAEAGCCGCCCGCCKCCCCPQPPIIIQPPPAIHKICHVPCCCCKPCCCKPCCCCCGCGGGRKKRSSTYRNELMRKRRANSDFVYCRQSMCGDENKLETLPREALFPLLTPFNDEAIESTTNMPINASMRVDSSKLPITQKPNGSQDAIRTSKMPMTTLFSSSKASIVSMRNLALANSTTSTVTITRAKRMTIQIPTSRQHQFSSTTIDTQDKKNVFEDRSPCQC